MNLLIERGLMFGNLLRVDYPAGVALYHRALEKLTGKTFGDAENPLLVSVRSGARASMPGMMDTVLNLGLNDDVSKLRRIGEDRSFAVSA